MKVGLGERRYPMLGMFRGNRSWRVLGAYWGRAEQMLFKGADRRQNTKEDVTKLAASYNGTTS